MMDYLTQQSPEHGLVQRLVQASSQLQREEGFCSDKQQDIARSLGINWFQATSFKQALKSIDTFLKDHKSEPTQEMALVKGLKTLLSELLPTLFALRLSEDCADYMPDENGLLERLRHHYVLELIYQERYAQPKKDSSAQILDGMGSPLQNSLGIDLWFANLDSAIRYVYDELGLNKAYVKNIISGNINPLLEDSTISQTDKSLFVKFISAVESTRKELEADYEKKSRHFRPNQLSSLIPSMDEIRPLIRSNIHEEYLTEEKKAARGEHVQHEQSLPSESPQTARQLEQPRQEKRDMAPLLLDFIKTLGGN